MDETMIWGLLGPETVVQERRVRTLGLGASVRHFNELAVPGIGNVWFGKQLLLALTGILVAEKAREAIPGIRNIQASNAIEAIACWSGFSQNDWQSDSRLRGITKLRGKSDLSFATVTKPGFYVSQPMRVSTVQALPALGLVDTESALFNRFSCNHAGKDFIEAAFEEKRPYNRSVIGHLTKWVRGQDPRVDNDKLKEVLSPIRALSENARNILRELLIQSNCTDDSISYMNSRRRKALEWVDEVQKQQKPLNWNTKPNSLSSDHWEDLHAGALFFTTRDAALQILNELEQHIGNNSKLQTYSLKSDIPVKIKKQLQDLRQAAKNYLDKNNSDTEAKRFCIECTNTDSSEVIKNLVDRDGRILRLVGQEIRPGPAFRVGSRRGVLEQDQEGGPNSMQGGNKLWPEGISERISNLFYLNIDLHGELDAWLNTRTEETP